MSSRRRRKKSLWYSISLRLSLPRASWPASQKEEALPERVQLALLVALTWHAPAADAYRHRCDVHRWHLRRMLPCSSSPASSSAVAAAASASSSSSSAPPPPPATLAAAEKFIGRALDAADAATPADATQTLSPTDRCMLSYDVGEYHFSQSAFGPSALYLRRAQQLLKSLPPDNTPPVPTERLHGFLTACALVQPDASAAAAAAADNDIDASPLLACEHARHAGDVPAILACLRIPSVAQGVKDSLPAGYRSALEEDNRLDRHARACVTAVNVVHEMMVVEDTDTEQGGEAPPEVTLRLMPYVTASRESTADERRSVAGAFMDAVDAAAAATTMDETSRLRLRRAVSLLCEHCEDLPADLQTRAAKHLYSKSGGGVAAAVAAEPMNAHESSSSVSPRRLLQAAGTWQSPTFALSRWLSAHDTPLSTGLCLSAPSTSKSALPSSAQQPAPSVAAAAVATKRPREEDETTADDRPSKRQSTQQGKAGGGGGGGAAGAGAGPESTARGALQALQTALTGATDSASSTSAPFSAPDADVTARVLARCLDAPEAAWPVLRRLTTAARERTAGGAGAGAAATTTTEAKAEAAHVALLGVAAALARCSEGATDTAASMTPYETLWHLLFCHFPSMHPIKKVRALSCAVAASHASPMSPYSPFFCRAVANRPNSCV